MLEKITLHRLMGMSGLEATVISLRHDKKGRDGWNGLPNVVAKIKTGKIVYVSTASFLTEDDAMLDWLVLNDPFHINVTYHVDFSIKDPKERLKQARKKRNLENNNG